MKKISKRASVLTIVILYFIFCSSIFIYRYTVDGRKWATHPSNLDAYKNAQAKNPGIILSGDGSVLYSREGYCEDEILRKATLHTVGDSGNNILSGVLRLKKPEFIGYDPINGVFNPSGKSSKISLTLDSQTCVAAYDALGKYNGTVGIYNYKTGEIICMVSKPSYDPLNVPDLTSGAYEGVYINRLISGLYTPGSIMKLITSAAAIDKIKDINERTFTCKGGIEIDGEWIKCTGNHGNIDFNTALAKSCNAAYAVIAVELGAETLSKYAQKAGIGKSFDISSVNTSKGRINLDDVTENQLAWAGIGQHTTLVNPMQYLILMGAVANEGKAIEPYYIKGILSTYSLPQYYKLFPNSEARMLSEDCAGILKDMMRNNVKTNYGEKGFENLNLCAKTGTAEIDNKKPHSWFAGFLDNEEAPLAFVVIAENSVSGSQSAIPIARAAISQAVKTFLN